MDEAHNNRVQFCQNTNSLHTHSAELAKNFKTATAATMNKQGPLLQLVAHSQHQNRSLITITMPCLVYKAQSINPRSHWSLQTWCMQDSARVQRWKHQPTNQQQTQTRERKLGRTRLLSCVCQTAREMRTKADNSTTGQGAYGQLCGCR